MSAGSSLQPLAIADQRHVYDLLEKRKFVYEEDDEEVGSDEDVVFVEPKRRKTVPSGAQ